MVGPILDERLPVIAVVPAAELDVARHPYDVYLGQLSGESLRTMRGCLDRLARLLAGVSLDAPTETDVGAGAPLITGDWVPWWHLTYTGTSGLRAVLLDIGWSAAHINKHLSALRRVLKESWRLGLMEAEAYQRAADLEPVSAKREPAGRDVPLDELEALLATCDDTPVGIRDAAVIALVYTSGLRRSEAAALAMHNYLTGQRALRIVGKGNKERTIPIAQAAQPWLDAWLRIRGGRPGPFFCALRKGGTLVYRHLSPQTLADLLDRRRLQAGIALPVKPHDLRRTLIGDLLDNGVDLVTAQQLAGHADPRTTSKYDRRGLDTKRDAVDGLRLSQPQTE
jgi:site-specific recombinase XerD